ncbi:hypothetical protein DL93DRAFT_2100990 [Clavulina sp. PMI_390]|nr:hypothetical protein DL93DRAFT_2100990 [Clavulina sp. PMI_390]
MSMNTIIDEVPLSSDESFVLNSQNPAVSLLPELLSAIFNLVLQNYGDKPLRLGFIRFYLAYEMRLARFTLCAVCSRWRQVALNTPTLWSVITFPNRLKVKGDPDYPAPMNTLNARSGHIPLIAKELFAEELRRSGQASLLLFVAAVDDDRGWVVKSNTQRLMDIAKHIKPILHRCRHLHFKGERALLCELLSHSDPFAQSQLHSISIRLYPDIIQDNRDDMDLTNAVNLRALTYESFSVIPFKLSLPTSNTSIQSLKIEGPFELEGLVSILTQIPTLDQLHWFSTDWSERSTAHIPPIFVHHLRHLTLLGSLPVSLLAALDTPNLLRLEISSPWELCAPPNKDYHLHPFALRCYSKLRVLNLRKYSGMTRQPEYLISNFIQTHPSLQVIALPGALSGLIVQKLLTLPSLVHVRAASSPNGHEAATIHLLRQWAIKHTKVLKASKPPIDAPAQWLPPISWTWECAKTWPSLYIGDNSRHQVLIELRDQIEGASEEPRTEFEIAKLLLLRKPTISNHAPAEYWDNILSNL